ncbi:uncharacterized protein DNG_09674 [Cephalotrichum gorgonifer]|uniref:Zn(2)-C6 fungal-type domain-containing protein n=1 Tax=Cephalotrichum gorgonifer TaxID=2041049 RepID=A0AAE8N653_9PEZI|nr:uncharacterized protein DNG_09674 [Cephalotrichum gorgonifer]
MCVQPHRDEGKPRCQRCVSGGFECQYGTRLSFLDKNAITPSQGGQQSPAPAPSYRKVQFVSDALPQRQDPTTARRSSASPPDTFGQQSPRLEPERLLTSRLSNAHTTEVPFVASPPPLDHDTQADSPEGFTPTVGYEIALDALLSLGADKSGPAITQTYAPQPPFSPPERSLPSVDHVGANGISNSHVNRSTEPTTESLEISNAPGFSDHQILGLLRYYRYEVAPWLDICDLGQSFGILVPCLASVSKPVLYSVLNLTASLTGQAIECERQGDVQDHPAVDSDSFVSQLLEEDISTRLICRVLAGSKQILSNELGASSYELLDEILELFSSPPMPFPNHPTNMTLYYLILRLDLSSSLVSGQPPRVPLYTPHDFPFGQRSPLASKVFTSTSEILVLLAQTMTLIFGAHDTTHGETRVEKWTSLLEGLGTWFTNRCQEFTPMVEVDGKQDAFPTLLFTNGAGLLANQIYHTAMLLMLQNRPRTIKLPGVRMSSAMSSLWHARRVCGIALANDSRECWDPSLVASFVVASRGMTHSAQHLLLLNKLREIGRLTGWKVDHYRAVLMEEWGV